MCFDDGVGALERIQISVLQRTS